MFCKRRQKKTRNECIFNNQKKLNDFFKAGFLALLRYKSIFGFNTQPRDRLIKSENGNNRERERQGKGKKVLHQLFIQQDCR